MVRLALAAILCAASPAAPATQGRAPHAEWYEANGEPIGGGSVWLKKLPDTHLRPDRFTQFAAKPAKTIDGRLATAVGFNAWYDGKRVHVTTVLCIPKDPDVKPEKGDDHRDFFTYTLLTRFTLAVGEARSLVEMKQFGWPPVTIRIHPPGFKH